MPEFPKPPKRLPKPKQSLKRSALKRKAYTIPKVGAKNKKNERVFIRGCRSIAAPGHVGRVVCCGWGVYLVPNDCRKGNRRISFCHNAVLYSKNCDKVIRA